jgi:hypothetical protein
VGRGWRPGFFGAGDVRVYDASSGDLLATFVPPGDVGFLNDVAIMHDAVYVTDSFIAQLVKIPLPADGSLPAEDSVTLLPVTGDFVQAPGVANLNGIIYKSGVLIVADSNTGKLFRVDPDTGKAEEIDLGGVALTNVDGLELQGHTLYAVRNTNQVTVVRLDSQLATGTVLGDITDPGLDVRRRPHLPQGAYGLLTPGSLHRRLQTRSTGSPNCHCAQEPEIEG